VDGSGNVYGTMSVPQGTCIVGSDMFTVTSPATPYVVFKVGASLSLLGEGFLGWLGDRSTPIRT
jgi:hypothetical protein